METFHSSYRPTRPRETNRPTQIAGGVQFHHQSNLNDAATRAVNMTQSLRGVAELTGSPRHLALVEAALALCREIGAAHRDAVDTLNALRIADRPRFDRCRAGEEPWPDERPEGFEAICTCERRCLHHDTQAVGSSYHDCNCDAVCPRHHVPRVPGDRRPLLPLMQPDAMLPVELPTLAELGRCDHSACAHQAGRCRLYAKDWE